MGGGSTVDEEKGGGVTISSSLQEDGDKFKATIVIINGGMFNFHVLVVVKW